MHVNNLELFISHHESQKQEILSGQLCVSMNILVFLSFSLPCFKKKFKLDNRTHLLKPTNNPKKALLCKPGVQCILVTSPVFVAVGLQK